MLRSRSNWMVIDDWPEHADRGHLRDAGDLRELVFERLGDRARHRLGAGAGELGGHRDGGEIDARQRRDRQQRIGGDADQHEGRHQQRGGDRPADERGGDAHVAIGPLSVSRRSWPASRPAGGVVRRHPGALLQARLAVGDDDLVVVQPLGDHRHRAVVARDLDVLPRHSRIRLDDIDVQAARSVLHRDRRHRQHVAFGAHQQPRVDELAGPQRVVRDWGTSPSA